MQTIVLIPARMASTRLPGKPMAEIGGLPMIVHVARRGRESAIGRVVVATDAPEIVEAVQAAGFEAIMTDAGHGSGSDRIKEALDLLDPGGEFDAIVNLQGDLPTIEPDTIRAVMRPLRDADVDIATVAVRIVDDSERADPAVVKVVGTPVAEKRLRALYFTRTCAPWGEGDHFHHVGIYAYRRPALERFVALPPSPLEERERLEQLRALEAGMRIDIEIVEAAPLGVDTTEHLERAREILARESGGR